MLWKKQKREFRTLGVRGKKFTIFNLSGKVGFFGKVTFGWPWRRGCRYQRKSILSKEDSQCKSPKVGGMSDLFEEQQGNPHYSSNTKATQRKRKLQTNIPH